MRFCYCSVEIFTIFCCFFSAKRSWFSNFRSEKEKEEVVVVHRDKGFQDLKVSLIQAFKVSSVKLALRES